MEKIWVWLSWIMPKRLAYWAAIRVMTFNYDGNPCERSCTQALKGWN